MSKFLNNRYQNLEAYTPGEQPQDMRYIKLNTNESPFPPSPSVIKAITEEEIQDLRLYSDPECRTLKEKLADFYNVTPDNIFVSNGSDDILNFSFMAFSGNPAKAVFPEITYGFYKVFADLHSVDYEKIPLNTDFSININDYLSINNFIVVANPNAPTGAYLKPSDIEKIVASNPENIVLIDEAYIDFGGESCIPLTKKYKNLLVVQTYSKSRSMAGARLGFAIADKEIISDLNKIKYSTNPYNINRLTLVAGTSALDDSNYYKNNCEIIIKNREYTSNVLRELGFLVLPSKANFVFASSPKISGFKLYSELKKRGILIRHFSDEKICEYNRITIGTKNEMDIFLKAVEEIMKENYNENK